MAVNPKDNFQVNTTNVVWLSNRYNKYPYKNGKGHDFGWPCYKHYGLLRMTNASAKTSVD